MCPLCFWRRDCNKCKDIHIFITISYIFRYNETDKWESSSTSTFAFFIMHEEWLKWGEKQEILISSWNKGGREKVVKSCVEWGWEWNSSGKLNYNSHLWSYLRDQLDKLKLSRRSSLVWINIATSPNNNKCTLLPRLLATSIIASPENKSLIPYFPLWKSTGIGRPGKG